MAEEKETSKAKEKSTEKSESKKKAPVLLIVLIVIAAALIVGGILIRRSRDFALSNIMSSLSGEKVQVEQGGDKVTITSEEGEFTFEEEGKLPDNFPADFPIYPGAKLMGSWTATGDETEGLSLMWETDDSVSKVGSYYKTELEKAGWTLSFTSESEDTTTFAFEKDGVSGFIGITIEDSKTVISLTLGL